MTVLANKMPPINLKISGVVKVGQVLKVSVSSLMPGSTVQFQWLLDGKTIKGAAKSTYKLVSSQKCRKISVKVNQSKLGYLAAASESAPAIVR